MVAQSISKTSPADKVVMYFLFAFIVMVGLSYINFLPGLVSALAGGIGFSEAVAGQIVALNGYGGLLGSIVAIFLVRRVHWRGSLLICLSILAMMDFSTEWIVSGRMNSEWQSNINNYQMMLGWRFLAGVFGGLSVGIGFSVLARLNNPDRAFGALLFVQFSVGSLVVYGLPTLESLVGAYAVFDVMASLIVVGLLLLVLLPALPHNAKPIPSSQPLPKELNNALLLMFAIFLYQCAAGAIWAYVGLVGLQANFTAEDVSAYIATTGLLGLLGAILPMLKGNPWGRLISIAVGIALSIVAVLMLSISPQTSFIYVCSMSLLFFSWPAVLSYLLAVTAELDASGRLSAMAALISSVGLASGPLMASSLLGDGDFSAMLLVSGLLFLLCALAFYKPVSTQERTYKTQGDCARHPASATSID